MLPKELVRKAQEDPLYRFETFYQIIDKDGIMGKIKLNWMQKQLFNEMHTRNLILKARQLGSTTFWALYFLDKAIWNDNKNIGIISHNLDSAQRIFKRIIRLATENMHPAFQEHLGIRSESARELQFANNSTLYVDSTVRSGTVTDLLITEYGKLCARYPLKAEEVITGSLNALTDNGTCVIESTAEGIDGYFYDMCKKSEARGTDNLGNLEFKFFFFPWWKNPEYEANKPTDLIIPDLLEKYFSDLAKNHKIELNERKRYWYYQKWIVNGEKTKQEYPSIPEEAFIASSEAYFYAKAISDAKKDGRITSIAWNPEEPVYVAIDLGLHDFTSIWFYQVINSVVYFIDFFEDNNKDPDFYIKFLLQDKPYTYGGVYLPHDGDERENITLQTRADIFRRLMGPRNIHVQVLGRTKDVALDIHNTKLLINRAYFHEVKCAEGLQHLSRYKKKWRENVGWLSEPQHNDHSHAADALRYACNSLSQLGISSSNYIELHKKALEARKFLV